MKKVSALLSAFGKFWYEFLIGENPAAFFGTLSRDAENKTSKGGKSFLRMNVRTGLRAGESVENYRI